MRIRKLFIFIITTLLQSLMPLPVAAGSLPDVPAGQPAATINLATDEGVALVKGQWRYSDTKIIEADFKAPGPDSQPTGEPIKTYDYTPHAGGTDFDDSQWEAISASSLDKRRSTGRLCFNWYRIRLTIPDKVADFDPTGSTVVFETSLDDYAEIWVDGELARFLGQEGGSVISGWNAPNRLVIGRNVKPARRFNSLCSASTGPFRIRPRISSGCATRNWTFTKATRRPPCP